MSDHGGGGGRNGRGVVGMEFALLALFIGWILVREGAGPLAHAVGGEFGHGVPVVALPFQLLSWAIDETLGDIRREMLGKEDR